MDEHSSVAVPEGQQRAGSVQEIVAPSSDKESKKQTASRPLTKKAETRKNPSSLKLIFHYCSATGRKKPILQVTRRVKRRKSGGKRVTSAHPSLPSTSGAQAELSDGRTLIVGTPASPPKPTIDDGTCVICQLYKKPFAIAQWTNQERRVIFSKLPPISSNSADRPKGILSIKWLIMCYHRPDLRRWHCWPCLLFSNKPWTPPETLGSSNCETSQGMVHAATEHEKEPLHALCICWSRSDEVKKLLNSSISSPLPFVRLKVDGAVEIARGHSSSFVGQHSISSRPENSVSPHLAEATNDPDAAVEIATIGSQVRQRSISSRLENSGSPHLDETINDPDTAVEIAMVGSPVREHCISSTSGDSIPVCLAEAIDNPDPDSAGCCKQPCLLDKLLSRSVAAHELILEEKPSPDFFYGFSQSQQKALFSEPTVKDWVTSCRKLGRVYCWPCLLVKNHQGYPFDAHIATCLLQHHTSHEHLVSECHLVNWRRLVLERNRFIRDNGADKHFLKHLIDAICFIKSLPNGAKQTFDDYKGVLQLVSTSDPELNGYLNGRITSCFNLGSLVDMTAVCDAVEASLADVLRARIIGQIKNSRYVSLIVACRDSGEDTRAGSCSSFVLVRYLEDSLLCERIVDMMQGIPEFQHVDAVIEAIPKDILKNMVSFTHHDAINWPRDSDCHDIAKRHPAAVLAFDLDDDLFNYLLKSFRPWRRCYSLGNELVEFLKVIERQKCASLTNVFATEFHISLDRLVHDLANDLPLVVVTLECIISEGSDWSPEVVRDAQRYVDMLKDQNTLAMFFVVAQIVKSLTPLRDVLLERPLSSHRVLQNFRLARRNLHVCLGDCDRLGEQASRKFSRPQALGDMSALCLEAFAMTDNFLSVVFCQIKRYLQLVDCLPPNGAPDDLAEKWASNDLDLLLKCEFPDRDWIENIPGRFWSSLYAKDTISPSGLAEWLHQDVLMELSKFLALTSVIPTPTVERRGLPKLKRLDQFLLRCPNADLTELTLNLELDLLKKMLREDSTIYDNVIYFASAILNTPFS